VLIGSVSADLGRESAIGAARGVARERREAAREIRYREEDETSGQATRSVHTQLLFGSRSTLPAFPNQGTGFASPALTGFALLVEQESIPAPCGYSATSVPPEQNSPFCLQLLEHGHPLA